MDVSYLQFIHDVVRKFDIETVFWLTHTTCTMKYVLVYLRIVFSLFVLCFYVPLGRKTLNVAQFFVHQAFRLKTNARRPIKL